MGYFRISGAPARFGTALFLVSVISALSLSGLTGCREAGKGFGKDVLAVVDGEPVTVAEFKAATGGAAPEDAGERGGALKRIIYNRLAARVAVAEGVIADPAVLGRIEEFYNDRLPDALRNKIGDGVTVSDEELAGYKKKDILPSFNVSLFVAPTAEEAEAGLSELRKGVSFKDVAGKRSTLKGETDFEVRLGDDLYPAGVRAVLNRLKPGELSPVMKLETGYAVFKLNQRREPEEIWTADKGQIRGEVRMRKAEAELARLVDRLRASADVKLNTVRLPDGKVRYLGAVVDGVEINMDPGLFSNSGDPHAPHIGMNPQTLRDALNRQVNNVLLAQEARRRGLHNDPQFQLELRLKKEEIYADALEDKVAGTYNPTRKDLEDYFEKNKARFASKPKVRVSRILLATEADAKAVLRELKSGKDFSALAREKSTDKAAKDTGGDVGPVSYELLKEPLKGTLAALKVGEVSGVLKSEYGYEVLKATARMEGTPPAFSTMTGTIRKRVILQKRSEAVEALYKEVSGRAKVEVNEALLKSLK